MGRVRITPFPRYGMLQPMGEAHRNLREYLFSMLQTTEYMVEKSMTQGAASVKITSVP